jgi:hypothetical protein
MKRHLAAAAVVLALLPLPLRAQSGDPAGRIEAAQQRVAAAGIPASILENQVAEGRAKGIAPERVAAAVERRGAALLRAQEAMGGGRRDLSAADLSSGANAVEAGVDAGALRGIADVAHAADRPVAIAVLTYLHEQGVPIDRALEQVTRALKQGPEALRDLPAQAAAAAARRGPPAAGGGRPAGAGSGAAGKGGPPEGVPPRGGKPGGGKPGGGKPAGTPGGRP